MGLNKWYNVPQMFFFAFAVRGMDPHSLTHVFIGVSQQWTLSRKTAR